jgi:hypothetical protein
VEVTSHHRPIARITGLQAPHPAVPSQSLQKAIEAGLISWSGQKPVFPPPVQLPGEGKPISAIVLEDRD